MTWQPSLWTQLGSTLLVVLVQLPVALPPMLVARRLIYGQW